MSLLLTFYYATCIEYVIYIQDAIQHTKTTYRRERGDMSATG